MIRKVEYKGNVIEYNLVRKRVKNINLRIKPDFSINVSANKRVSLKYIDEFVISKGKFILSTFDKFKNQTFTNYEPLYSENDFTDYILQTFNEVNVLFKDRINVKPVLKFREMKSRWGSCNYIKGVITLNSNLIYCTKEQIYYVIVHEFSHFLVHNHSADFYKVVAEYCKDYKRINKELNKIILQ